MDNQKTVQGRVRCMAVCCSKNTASDSVQNNHSVIFFLLLLLCCFMKVIQRRHTDKSLKYLVHSVGCTH